MNQENGEHGGGFVRRRGSRLRGVSPPPFLSKLYEMVEDPETDDLIHWTSGKATFVITNPNMFCVEVLPKYFKHSNLSSFIYQLNNYGFRKVSSYRSEYENTWFQGGKKHWLKNIKSRIQLSKAEKAQQGSSSSPSVDLLKDNLEEKLENLKNNHITLKIELQELKEKQEKMRVQFPAMLGLKLFLDDIKVRGESSSNDTRKKPRLMESQDHVAATCQDGIGQTSNSAGGSVSSNEEQKEEATARNEKNREFWKKLFDDDSESENGGSEAQRALNHSKALVEIEEMVENKIAMEGEALIAKVAAAGLLDEMEAYLQPWTWEEKKMLK